MRLLVNFVHWPLAFAWNYVRAFRRLGHDVKTAGTFLENRGYWAANPSMWEPDVPFGVQSKPGWFDAPAEAALRVLQAEDWQSDAIITASYFFTLSGKAEVPHVLINFEPPEYNPHERGDFRHDYEFTSDYGVTPDERCEYLPLGYCPELHRNIIPLKYRAAAASYVGRMGKARRDFIQEIQTNTWLIAGVGITPDQYVTLTNAARAAIHFPLHDQNGATNRAWEYAAMGAVFISTRNEAMDAEGLIPEVNYLEYDGTAADCKRQIDRVYDEGIEWAQTIVDNATRWVRPQTYDARCERIVEVLQCDLI